MPAKTRQVSHESLCLFANQEIHLDDDDAAADLDVDVDLI